METIHIIHMLYILWNDFIQPIINQSMNHHNNNIIIVYKNSYLAQNNRGIITLRF